MINILNKRLILLLCFFVLPVNATEVDFSGFNKIYYDMGKNTLPFLKDYQSGKKKMEAIARENKLDRNFVDKVENNLLLLLASSSKTRNSILKSITHDALSKKLITPKEKKLIDKIFFSITKNNIKNAKLSLNSLKIAMKTPVGKVIYIEIGKLLNKLPDGTSNEGNAQSQSGALAGGAAGAVAGGIAGGVFSGGNPAGIGAGAVIGIAIGSWLGDLFSPGGTKTTTTTTHPDGTTTTTTTESGVWLGPNGQDAEICDGPPDLKC